MPQPPNESKCCCEKCHGEFTPKYGKGSYRCINPLCSCHHILVNNSAGYPILAHSCVPTPTNREWDWRTEFDKTFKCNCILCVEKKHEFTTTTDYMMKFIARVEKEAMKAGIETADLQEIEAVSEYRADLYAKVEGIDTGGALYHEDYVQGFHAAIDKVLAIIRPKK